MSDYAVADEKARLYDLAVEYGMVPKDWDGENPNPPTVQGAQAARTGGTTSGTKP